MSGGGDLALPNLPAAFADAMIGIPKVTLRGHAHNTVSGSYHVFGYLIVCKQTTHRFAAPALTAACHA